MPPTPSSSDSLFTDAQRTRARALDAARAVLVQRGAFNSGQVNSVVDLITVAQWIIDGKDPWPVEHDAEPGEIYRESSVEDWELKENPDAEPSGEPTDEGIQAD